MKKRLDIALPERGLVRTRSRAADLIRSGAVRVNGTVQTKTGALVASEDEIVISANTAALEIAAHSVGRGAVKLSFALKKWKIPVTGLCIDVGASTGGFTEILLKNGADCVIAVDVGRDQLDRSLRGDHRVISLEGLDIRMIASREDLVSVAIHESSASEVELDRVEQIRSGAKVITCDVSFISLTKVLPSIRKLGCEDCHFVFLIKPQFEMEKRKKRKNGIVNSAKDREEAVRKVVDFARGFGLAEVGIVESPIRGGDGNVEYLAYFKDFGGRL